MALISIDYKNFVSGEGQSDLMGDRGFSPASYGLNLTKSIGALNFIETANERGGGGTTLTGNIVAATYDKNYLGEDGYFVDDEGAFYTLNGTTLTKRQSTTSSTPVLGTTELIQFLGATYCSTGTQIMQLNGSDLTGAFDPGWWETGITANYRHPMERVENTLYIGNVNLISTWDGTTSTLAGITLPTDVNVTSLRKHPDGKTLIAFCGTTANFSHTRGGAGRIYLIDTNTKSWTREIDIPTQVEGSRVVNGVVYVSYGFNVGYFNGNGVSFLKRLNTSATTYSHNMVAFENYLVVRDGLNALAYGDLGGGPIWWNIYKNTTNSQNLNCLFYRGDNKMMFAYSNGSGAGLLDEIDYDNSGTNGAFVSNRLHFGATSEINKIEIVHGKSNSAGTTTFVLHQRDYNGTINLGYGESGQIASVSYTNQTVVESIIGTNIKTSIFQLYLALSTDTIDFKEIRIYYEPIN